MATDLATLPQLATYLGGPVANEEQAGFALAAASALIVSHCGWSIADERSTWALAGNGTDLLFVPTLMLRDIVSVYADGQAVDIDDVTFSSSGVISRAAGWPYGAAAVVITVDQGYEEIPAELVAVCCSLASRWVATAGKGPVSSYRVGGVQVSFASGSPGEVIGLNATERLVLDRYRLPGLR